MHSTSRFIQGIYPFVGQGLDKPVPLHPTATYVVPAGITAQAVYFRGGNSCDELVCVTLVRDGAPMRLFPIGAKSEVHVPLRVVENLLPDTRLELHVGAPDGVQGLVVVDFGVVEV